MIRHLFFLLLRSFLVILLFACLGWWFADAPAPLFGHGFVERLTVGFVAGMQWARTHSQQGAWIVLVAGGWVIVGPVLRDAFAGGFSLKDPVRAFTDRDRLVGFARAEQRCEMDGWFWMRCPSTAEHGDHWYPHSKGGRTSLANFVAACEKCNLAKSSRWPTWGQTQRIAFRRRAYFPPGFRVRPGEKY